LEVVEFMELALLRTFALVNPDGLDRIASYPIVLVYKTAMVTEHVPLPPHALAPLDMLEEVALFLTALVSIIAIKSLMEELALLQILAHALPIGLVQTVLFPFVILPHVT